MTRAARSDDDRRQAERERQQRHRARRRNGLALIGIEAPADIADALTETGRLSEWDDQNPVAIMRALSILIGDWQQAVTRDGVDPVTRAMVRANPEEADNVSLRQTRK